MVDFLSTQSSRKVTPPTDSNRVHMLRIPKRLFGETPGKRSPFFYTGLTCHFWVVMLRNQCRFPPFFVQKPEVGGYAPELLRAGGVNLLKITFYIPKLLC